MIFCGGPEPHIQDAREWGIARGRRVPNVQVLNDTLEQDFREWKANFWPSIAD